MIINKKLLGKISNSYVIEKGGTDNTNFYAKYSDGTLIQWGVSTFNDKITIANGNGLYRSENQITKNVPHWGGEGVVYAVCLLVTQSCPTLWDPMDHSPPGSSVHGIL